MRWLFLCVFLMALTPISNDYKNPENTYGDMRNLFDNAQDRSHTIVQSTPSYQELRDGEIVIYQSSANVKDVSLMLRAGTTIYASPMFPIIKVR